MIRAGMLKLGGSVLEQLLAADPGYRGPRIECGAGHEAEFISYRDKVTGTVLGPVAVSRAWYHCAACGHGLSPRDAELGVAGQSMSPGLAAMNDRVAAAGPFAKAAGLLEDLAGVHLTAKRVERSAEASGTARAAADRSRARAIAARRLVPLPPSPLPDKLYAAIDGTGVPVTAKETAGRDGKAGDGRARTREVKLAVLFTQDKVDDEGYPVRDPDSSSYIATFEPAHVFADLVEAEGIRRGAHHIRQFTILGDGAAWICYPDIGIADLIPVPLLSRGSSIPAWDRRAAPSGPGPEPGRAGQAGEGLVDGVVGEAVPGAGDQYRGCGPFGEHLVAAALVAGGPCLLALAGPCFSILQRKLLTQTTSPTSASSPARYSPSNSTTTLWPYRSTGNSPAPTSTSS